MNAIGAVAVDYLLKGCGCDKTKERALDLDRDQPTRGDHQPGYEHAREHGREAERGQERESGGGVDYLGRSGRAR